jgi:choline dehydrogenase-like flavoprotein
VIRDLCGSPVSSQQIATDVLVIGAGIAGLLVATRLARAGRRVLVAESGGLTQTDETHPLNEVEQVGEIYTGAERGRFRCLGGTSTRWGGAMLPFQAADLALHPSGWNVEWPIALSELTSYQGEIERLFKLGGGPYDVPEIMPGPGGAPPLFLSRLAKWPPFRFRNVATLLADDIHSEMGPEVWLNATATNFAFEPAGRLESVKLRSINGNILSVAARETVVAAGAIESTRLLLLADRQHEDRIFAPDNVLGRYFHDHLSAPVARLADVRRTALNRVIGFRFDGAAMRNLRFEPSADLRAKRKIPAGFAHIAFRTDKPTAFDALRDLYRKLQRRGRPSMREVVALASGMPWLWRAVWWRLVEKRLLFPDAADLDVHIVIEQEPRADNRIGLSPRRIDRFGCALAAIDWRVHDDDAANVQATTEAFVDAWNSGSLAGLARIEPGNPGDLKRALTLGGGIWHPGGSVRMGNDVSRAVVDGELRTFRVPNLSVVSTATFPTGGGANPTMMLMMAALRTADRIVRQYGRPPRPR